MGTESPQAGAAVNPQPGSAELARPGAGSSRTVSHFSVCPSATLCGHHTPPAASLAGGWVALQRLDEQILLVGGLGEAGGSHGQGRLCWGLPELSVQPAHSTRAAPAPFLQHSQMFLLLPGKHSSSPRALGEGQTPARGATTGSNLPSGDRAVSLERGCSHSMPCCPSQTQGHELPWLPLLTAPLCCWWGFLNPV